MARQRSPDREKAENLYIKSNGEIKLKDIADTLGLPEGTVRGWKNKDKWEQKLNGTFQKGKRNAPKDKKLEHKKAQRNRSGNPNPKNQFTKRNKAAEKHGFFSKYLPEETLEVIQEIREKDPLDILWENITIQYAAIIRAQRIMLVESKEEMIKELKKSKVKSSTRKTEKTTSNSTEEEYEYEFQFAWDRQATFLNAQSRAMCELRNLIKQYDEMLNVNWDMATEEQKLRIQKLKADISKDDGKDKPIEILIKRKGED